MMYPYQKLSREMGHPSICMLLLFGCKLKFVCSQEPAIYPSNLLLINVDICCFVVNRRPIGVCLSGHFLHRINNHCVKRRWQRVIKDPKVMSSRFSPTTAFALTNDHCANRVTYQQCFPVSRVKKT